jgi:hypothetical protein
MRQNSVAVRRHWPACLQEEPAGGVAGCGWCSDAMACVRPDPAPLLAGERVDLGEIPFRQPGGTRHGTRTEFELGEYGSVLPYTAER